MNHRIPPHPNILPLIGCYRADNGSYGLVFPFVSHGRTQNWLQASDHLNLLSYNMRYRIVRSLSTVIRLWLMFRLQVREIAAGLQHLHNYLIVHGDLHIVSGHCGIVIHCNKVGPRGTSSYTTTQL